MSGKRDNTIVTIGNAGYLWGIFLLAASARKAGMEEPFLVGCQGFGGREKRVLRQLGGMEFFPLDSEKRSMTCLKARTMLEAGTEWVTWADSDGFFTGNVSDILPPENPDGIHFRIRKPEELPGRVWRWARGLDGRSVPAEVMEVWRRDVEAVAGTAEREPRFTSTGSACFFALSLARYRGFLETYAALQERVLPERDVGVVDRTLKYYPQLDESTLNACLAFAPEAPAVQETYRMDKDRKRLFVHFVGMPKPWIGWTKRAFRFFDETVAVVEWAVARGLELPSPVPWTLKAENKRRCRMSIPWTAFSAKAKRVARRLLG